MLGFGVGLVLLCYWMGLRCLVGMFDISAVFVLLVLYCLIYVGCFFNIGCYRFSVGWLYLLIV